MYVYIYIYTHKYSEAQCTVYSCNALTWLGGWFGGMISAALRPISSV